MLNDIDRKPIAVEATTNLTPEYVTGNSQTFNDPAAAFVAQMYSLPTTTLTCVQEHYLCKKVIDRAMANLCKIFAMFAAHPLWISSLTM